VRGHGAETPWQATIAAEHYRVMATENRMRAEVDAGLLMQGVAQSASA